MEDVLINIEMNESLVQIKNEVSGMMRGAGREKGIGRHFEDLPF